MLKDEYKIIKHPILSEKGTALQESQNKYFFEVDVNANKIEIKRAVEKLYKVKVKSVNTLNMLGKKKRIRWQLGKRPDWKKAIVTLKEGYSIEFI